MEDLWWAKERVVAESLKVCGREKRSMLREAGLCGGVKELKTLESKEGNLEEWLSMPLSTRSMIWRFPLNPEVTMFPTYPQACAPLWSRACGSSVFSSGICAHVDASFQPQGSLAPTAQRKPEEGPEDSVLRMGCRVGKRWGIRVWCLTGGLNGCPYCCLMYLHDLHVSYQTQLGH